MEFPDLILLVVIVAGSFQISIGEGYRLPGTQIPVSYNIKLNFPNEIFDGTNATFSGTVSVTFETLIETKIVQIHSPSYPNNVKIANSSSSSNYVEPILKSFNSTTEILELSFADNLEPTILYELIIEYNADVDVIDRRGVYRSKYTDDLGLRHLITTQFQPTYARKAFPCFDEPKYKANFTLSLTYPSVGFNAMSNTAVDTTEESE